MMLGPCLSAEQQSKNHQNQGFLLPLPLPLDDTVETAYKVTGYKVKSLMN